MRGFDIYPFRLPNCNPGEIRFDEPHDISKVVLIFKEKISEQINLSYLYKYWHKNRIEKAQDMDSPCFFGWTPIDDWFNAQWRKAEIETLRESKNKIIITFQGLSKEFPEVSDYDVTFRRTLGIRLDTLEISSLRKIEVYTTSQLKKDTLRVELDAGRKTPTTNIRLYEYMSVIKKVSATKGISVKNGFLNLRKNTRHSFEISVNYMQPTHRYCNDDGHITFDMGDDKFTISLSSLDTEGPIWFEDYGVYITKAEDKTTFSEYFKRIKDTQTISEKVKSKPEQSFAGAYFGQPRPHFVSYNLGCKYARQRFWLEWNGDIFLQKANVTRIEGKDTHRFKNTGSARFFFGLEKWFSVAHFPDPPPVLAYNIFIRNGNLMLEQKSFAAPLLHSILEGEKGGDDTIIALVRFCFKNSGELPIDAGLSINYSQDSNRSYNPYIVAKQDDYLIPNCEMEKLSFENNKMVSIWNGQKVLRCLYESSMKPVQKDLGLSLMQKLKPGETCEVILKIPFIAIDSTKELTTLSNLCFEKCYEEVTEFWRAEGKRGAQIISPEPHLNDLHKSHLSHIQITDFTMPDDNELINTSVGTSTYGNFSNESCMVIKELEERGLHGEAGRRLGIWLKYQGTAPQPGNFTDYEGMFFGAGGFEEGYYNQHHGWVLWCLCQHFFHTSDEKWFRSIADSVIKGADWVFRQRRNTMKTLPHSRGWKYGFLPAGSLEDVTDFHYWLSTNALTWRGVEWVARALEVLSHPEAIRIRKEANAYRKDLIRGFEIMRQHSPLVRLRNGCWIPHYPGRLYCRGRDIGWIRETLEGSIYLLISGLYDSNSKQAGWILDDYQDNRYIKAPYGYVITDFENSWYDRAGFSIQPNLLAGLLPYLERDAPEIYIWMFYNAWCACYREEINAMVEHPAPMLGYSNSAHFKTSDEANAIMWLRYMYVYTSGNLLHFGRAIPRVWFEDSKIIELRDVSTFFGKVSVRYESLLKRGKILATVDLYFHKNPEKILVRFRPPNKLPIISVKINGEPSSEFEPENGDVNITKYKGEVKIEVRY